MFYYVRRYNNFYDFPKNQKYLEIYLYFEFCWISIRVYIIYLHRSLHLSEYLRSTQLYKLRPTIFFVLNFTLPDEKYALKYKLKFSR